MGLAEKRCFRMFFDCSFLDLLPQAIEYLVFLSVDHSKWEFAQTSLDGTSLRLVGAMVLHMAGWRLPGVAKLSVESPNKGGERAVSEAGRRLSTGWKGS